MEIDSGLTPRPASPVGRGESWDEVLVNTQGIVYGRHSEEKVELAKRLRRKMTPAERLLWQRLRRSALGGLHFRRQQIIDGFIVDFYCASAALVVEVDGEVHREQLAHDLERDQIIRSRGLKLLRFTNEMVFDDLTFVLEQIKTASISR